MLQTAERVMEEHCGKTVKAQFLGNAPCGFYQYYLPASAKMGTGVKVCPRIVVNNYRLHP